MKLRDYINEKTKNPNYIVKLSKSGKNFYIHSSNDNSNTSLMSYKEVKKEVDNLKKSGHDVDDDQLKLTPIGLRK